MVKSLLFLYTNKMLNYNILIVIEIRLNYNK